jgi:hypothetical protein
MSHRVAALGAAVRAGALGLVAATALATLQPASQPVAAESTGAAALGSGYFGVNFAYNTWDYPKDPGVDRQLAQLKPGTLRWPGGTEANTFDWRTGKSAGGTDPPFTLSDLLHAYQATGATPIFDLNVMTSTLSDQVAMLRQARTLGLPVRYVELGNELYGPRPDNIKAFPDGTAYGKTVAGYVTTLDVDFPGIEVAAAACLHIGAHDRREQTWNAEMLAAAKSGGGSPDAIILHDYPGHVYADLTAADLPMLFEGPYDGARELTSAISALGHPSTWLTEYNLEAKPHTGANPMQTTYAHALFVVEMDLVLPRVSDIARVDNWVAFHTSPVLGAWSGSPATPVLTPTGKALELVDAAAHGAQTSVPIAFKGVPALPGGDAAVFGRAFSSTATGPRAVVVNLTGQARTVPAGPEIPTGAAYEQVTGPPTAQMLDATRLTQRTGRVEATLSLPAYSITSIG